MNALCKGKFLASLTGSPEKAHDYRREGSQRPALFRCDLGFHTATRNDEIPAYNATTPRTAECTPAQ
ncbi:MAG TPA: hypothetical protein VFE51_16850 [Verrucomicrobiae bacterium]|nr:hypothetical protein [Verrucomicrobiae bacterium]